MRSKISGSSLDLVWTRKVAGAAIRIVAVCGWRYDCGGFRATTTSTGFSRTTGDAINDSGGKPITPRDEWRSTLEHSAHSIDGCQY